MRKMIKSILDLLHNLFYDEVWKIVYSNHSIENYLKKDFSDFNFHVLYDINVNEFHADPFGWVSPDLKYWVVYEHYYEKNNIGELRIGNVNFSNTSINKVPEIFWPKKNHLSYPYIYRENDNIFLFPESKSENKQYLITINSYTGEMISEKVIIPNISISDPSVIKHNGIYYMFGVTKSNDELFIWYSSSIEGEWKAHKKNPVKIDSHTSRPGGSIFYSESHLYRVAQDCSPVYGQRLAIMKILILNQNNFSEKLVKFIEAPKGDFSDGIHTMSHWGDKTLFDLRKWQFNYKRPFQKVYKKIKKKYNYGNKKS